MKHSLIAAIVICVVSGCGTSGPGATSSPTFDPQPSSTPPTVSSAPTSSSAPPIQDVLKRREIAPIEPGWYFIDPDGDPSTPLRVVFDVSAEGWSSWIGATKFSDAGHVGVSITTVSNLVTDGCSDHSWAEPPVGPSVDDLAAALASLAPFKVMSAASNATVYGYSGTHLGWAVPDMPVQGEGGDQRFTGCVGGELKSWVAFVDTASPGDAFYGYTGPGYTEEFWILDVEGTRLMIAAETSPGSPSADIAERDAILDSIRIEP